VPETSLVELEIAIGKLKFRNPQFWSDSGVKHYVLKCTDLFVLYGIRRNCHSSGRNLLLYQFIKRVIRLIVIIIGESPLINCLQNYIQHSSGQVNSICQWSYWWSSVWISY
jgi:hypothetical protein